MRARCGDGTAAWVIGALAAPGTQGSWWLGQEEIQWSTRVWQLVLASMRQYSCLENPLTEAWQATVYRLQREGCDGSDPASAMMQDYFLAVAALPQ